MISNLPTDLAEEILSRLDPLKSMRAVRLTCKKWNALSKSESFTKLHIDKAEAARREGESQVIVMMDYNVYLMNVVLNGIEDDDPYTENRSKLICLNDSEQVKISQVFNCEGLLLCILKYDNTKVVVWNPYWGQTRWIEPRYSYRDGYCDMYKYALGYENNNNKNKSCRSHKILRFIDDFFHLTYEMYDFDSDLWTTRDVTPHWRILDDDRGVSLKGNTYWPASERNSSSGIINHIICFDFTRESFGQLLPLPFTSPVDGTVNLSSVREEKLAALFQRFPCKIEIWVTSTIHEAEKMSWSKFLKVDTGPVVDFRIRFIFGSFFIDEEKKVAMVFEKDDECEDTINIIGEGGYFRQVFLGEPTEKWCWPHVCSYVPSFVQIKEPVDRKSKIQSDLEKLRFEQKILRLVALESNFQEEAYGEHEMISLN